jgi:hypothetical protein
MDMDTDYVEYDGVFLQLKRSPLDFFPRDDESQLNRLILKLSKQAHLI